MVKIDTQRLTIRNFKSDDWKDLQEYISRDYVMQFERLWDSSDDGIKKKAEDFSRGNSFWAVELKQTGKMIGHIYFSQIQPNDFQTWMLGYIFNNDYYGKGYATESCKGLLEFGFKTMGIHRVIAKCSPENVPSWRLLERLNMRREGHSLKCVTFKKTPDGEPIWWDEYLYAILAEEWPFEEILGNWNLKKPYDISEICVTKFENRKPNAWVINGEYVLKRFDNQEYLKRNIETSKVLASEGVPVAVPFETRAEDDRPGEDFCTIDNEYFCLYPRLKGKGLTDHFKGDYLSRAKYLGRIIGDLHKAFAECERVINCRDVNLLENVLNWALPKAMEFSDKRGVKLDGGIISDYKSRFGDIYTKLPRQIIHRDMHGENLLFENDRLTGYIDFDLAQKNVRIFDPCYMSTGILSGCIDDEEKREKWIDILGNIIEGYDETCNLIDSEKKAVIYVLYSIELIFIAYFSKNGYEDLAERNIKILNWLFENRSRLSI